MSKPWEHLVEADDRLRRLERAWKASPNDRDKLGLYHHALKQSDRPKADRLVMGEAEENQANLIAALEQHTRPPANLSYHSRTPATEPMHGNHHPESWSRHSYSYIGVYSGASDLGTIGLLTDIKYGTVRATFVPSSIIFHNGVEARLITGIIAKALGTGWRRTRITPQYEWVKGNWSESAS